MPSPSCAGNSRCSYWVGVAHRHVDTPRFALESIGSDADARPRRRIGSQRAARADAVGSGTFSSGAVRRSCAPPRGVPRADPFGRKWPMPFGALS